MHKWILEAGLERRLVKMGWTTFESFGSMIRLVSVLDVWHMILANYTLWPPDPRTRHTPKTPTPPKRQGIESWDQRAVDTRPKESSVEASGHGVSTSYCLFFCCVSWSDDIESVWAWRWYWDGIECRTCFDQGSRPHLRVSHVQISCFCIWHCVRLAMTLQNRLHCWFVFIDFSLQEACCPRWWEAAITNSSCLAEKVAVWLRASLIGILQKVVDCLRGVATTGFYHLFILFGVHKTFHDPGNQGVSWSFWDLSHVNMLHFHMNPSVPVASRSNQAGHRVDIDMEIPAENDEGFISFILWCILWLTAIQIKNLYFEVIRKMRYSYSLSLGLMGPVHGRGGAGFGAMRPRVATWRMCKMLEQGASRGGN